MTSTLSDIRGELEVDFGLGRERLLEARTRQKEKDTPQNRAAVAECWTRIDTVLDLLLELEGMSLV